MQKQAVLILMLFTNRLIEIALFNQALCSVTIVEWIFCFEYS